MAACRRLRLLLSLWLISVPAFASERILDFHSDVAAQADASLRVNETIRVHSESAQIRHGIVRDFPTRYRDRLGQSHLVRFELLDARCDGAPVANQQEQIPNGVRLRLGAADHLLAPGDHTYQLAYTVTLELGFFDDHDEIYWNVTGNGWIFPIDHASATVTLPRPVPAGKLSFTGYTGAQGATDKNFVAKEVSDATIRFSTTKPLEAKQGLTVVVGFPKGTVAEPSKVEGVRAFWDENASIIVGLAGFTLVLIYFLVAWFLVGRDPSKGTIVVRYEPPPGLSAPGVRFLKRLGYDDAVFACAVVELAVKGYLSIQQENDCYSLKSLRPNSGKLPVEEERLLRTLFSGGNQISLKNTQATLFGAARKALKSDLGAAEYQTLFRNNTGWFLVGLLLSLMTVAGMIMAMDVAGPARNTAFFLACWLSAWTLATGVLFSLVLKTRKAGRQVHRAAGSAAAPPLLFVIFFALAEVAGLCSFAQLTSVSATLIVAALAIVNWLFHRLLKVTTPAGRGLLDQIEGFRQYLSAVEGDRLQRLTPPEKTPELFEKFFPYALALGVDQQWAGQFTAVLAQAATAGGGTTGYCLSWYSGSDGYFDAGRFAGSFGSDFSSAISSASSPPGSSSGLDGGGSSGGGGGGGGGGGW